MRIVMINLLAAFCLAAISGGAVPGEGEILKNPSFEQVGDQPDRAAGWGRWGDWINEEQGWTPTHSGKGLIGYHHWQIEKPEDSGIYQDTKARAGGRYTFSIFVNHDNAGQRAQAEMIELRLESTVDGKQITLASTTAKVKDIATGNDWSNLSVSGTAANETLRVVVRIVPAKDGPRGGAVKLDDASLVMQPSR